MESSNSDTKLYVGIVGIELAKEFTILPGLIIRPVSVQVRRPIVFVKDGRSLMPPYSVEVSPSNFDITAELEVDKDVCELKFAVDPHGIPNWFERLLRFRCGPGFILATLTPCSLREPEKCSSAGIVRAPDRSLIQRNATRRKVSGEELRWVGRHLEKAIELAKREPAFELICAGIDEAYDHRTPSSALIALVGILEQVFTPENSGESRFRTAALVSAFLGPPGEERESFFKSVRKAYDSRSNAAHGRNLAQIDPVHETWALLIPIAVKMLLEEAVPKPEDCMRMLLLGEGDYRELSNDYELLPAGVHLPSRPDMKNLTDQQLLEKAEEFLKIAESLYGQKDSNWQIRALLRNKKPSPYTALFDKECEIWIGTPQTDQDYLWEVGQEVVHCLAPHDPKRILKLEEGISMIFGMKLAGARPIDGEYLEAYERTLRLLDKHPHCILNIRNKFGCSISGITSQMLHYEAPTYPEGEISWLTSLFTYGRPQTELDALK